MSAQNKTEADLATAALREMSVIDAIETSNDHPEAQAQIIDAYQLKYAELDSMDMVYWSRDEIPFIVFQAVRDLVILEVTGAFGQPIDAVSKDRLEEAILRRIRRHIAEDDSGHETKGEYM